jgi:AraC-like DNA-binding protein
MPKTKATFIEPMLSLGTEKLPQGAALELNEAAYLLGYEDSFVRAFRTWEGVPPARWREEQRARGAS